VFKTNHAPPGQTCFHTKQLTKPFKTNKEAINE